MNIMKKVLFMSLACLLLSIAVQAQQKVYCEMKAVNWRLKGIKMGVDFGTRSEWKDNVIVDSKGKEIVFNTPVEALNYMSAAGWSLEDVYQYMFDGDGSTRWIFSRYLQAGEDIEDGVMTTAKYKELRKKDSLVEGTAVLGGDRDSHGCVGSAGYTWSEVRQSCIRLWEDGVRMKPVDAQDDDADIFLILGDDQQKVELKYPSGESVVLDRRLLPSGEYVWNVEDDDTPNVRKVDGKWVIERRGQIQYCEF